MPSLAAGREFVRRSRCDILALMRLLLDLLTLSRRCDLLERRIKLLEFYMTAEADFRRRARKALQAGDAGAALQILSSYDEAQAVFVANGYSFSVGNNDDAADMDQYTRLGDDGHGHAMCYKSASKA